MKKCLLLLLSLLPLLTAQPLLAQQLNKNTPKLDMASGILEEVRKDDPATAHKMESAMKRGNFADARKIYEEFKSKKNEKPALDSATQEELTRAVQTGDMAEAQRILRVWERERQDEKGEKAPDEELKKASIFERMLSGNFPSSELMLDGLQQFGYDSFMTTAASIAPSTNAPVGDDYIIGPGDQLTLTLWGTTEGIFSMQVTKEGTITLPKVGVVSVAGLRFGNLEKTLKRHLSRYYSNFNLSVAMGTLRSMTVYVVGEITAPGSYTLSSLTTAYGALFAAGGPTKKGTMRSVRILRAGKVIKTLDLYDFLLKGDRGNDIRLQPEDTVFVPLIGPVAGVSGTVYRPAIYEMKGNETMEDLLRTAGGIMPIGLANTLQVSRFSNNERKLVIDIKTTASEANPGTDRIFREKVMNMDLLSVRPLHDAVWETVKVVGEVRYPGDYQWQQGMTVRDLVLTGRLLPTSEPQRAEVMRLSEDLKDRQVISVNLKAALDGDGNQNLALQPRDQVRIYTLYREAEKVVLTGEVMSPSEYEISKGERLSTLLRRAGGFTEEAYPYGAVLKRINVKESQDKNMQSLITKMQSHALQAAAGSAATAVSSEEAAFARSELNANQSMLENLKSLQKQTEGRVAINITNNIEEWAGSKEDLLLQEGDQLFIPKRPQEVLVLGEVYSPGAQIHQEGMSVKNYIERSGSYTKFAEEDQIFVLQANGFAFGADSPTVGNIEQVKLKAGDTVFVPQKMERHATMRITKDIIDILFKTAVVLATITVIF